MEDDPYPVAAENKKFNITCKRTVGITTPTMRFAVFGRYSPM